MAKGHSINDEIKEQKKKFKELSLSEKFQYIWEYYRLIIAAVIAVILVIASFIHAYIRNNYDTVCDIAVCDGKLTGYDTDDDLLTTGFTNYLGIDGKKERIHIDYSYTLEEKFLDQDPQISKEKNICAFPRLITLTDICLNTRISTISVLIQAVFSMIYVNCSQQMNLMSFLNTLYITLTVMVKLFPLP